MLTKATGWTTVESGLDSHEGGFSVHHSVYTGIWSHPTVQMILGEAAMGLKRPGCEAVYMAYSSAEVKNAWSCTYIEPYIFVACCLIKHGGTSSLLLTLFHS
jgi:hypothetical protein